MKLSPTALLSTALLAAQRAGDMVLNNISRRGDVAFLAQHDVKHKLDLESQILATETIQAAYPNAVILGEETCEQVLPESDIIWIIDPIDGTVNFFHGLPFWCCSIAASYKGKVVAAVVYAPELGWTFEATIDGPARCNGTILQVSATEKIDEAIICTGTNRNEKGEDALRFLRCLSDMAQRPRVLGSAALDLCMVAAGKADGYFECGVYIWDVAAAGLIVERAGGTTETMAQKTDYRRAFLASNGKLHSQMRVALEPLLKPF